jgi:parallel beta-helix repeat protein
MSQPGWGTAAGLCISANFDYKIPQSASWPDAGYTHISVYGDGFAQTDGSGWNWPDGWGNTDPSVFTSRGIEYYVGEPCYGSPYPNTAEIKIPLSLLTYAGDDGQIALGGQYWQYDWAEPFYVTLPVPQCTTDCYVDDASGDDSNGGTSWADAKKTIQAGIDQVDPGGTVHVASGTYTPVATIAVNKSVTSLGPQVGVDPRPSAGTARIPGGVSEAVVDGGGTLPRIFRITASDVVLDGLDVRNATGDMIDSPGGAGISNVALRYNIIRDALDDEGIQLRDCANCVIEFNHVFDIAQDGINLCCGSTGGIVQSNEVHDNSS